MLHQHRRPGYAGQRVAPAAERPQALTPRRRPAPCACGIAGVSPDAARTRTVTVDIKTGYEAVDYQEVARVEQLKPLELELRKCESMVDGIVSELEYMISRETALRDTNGAAAAADLAGGPRPQALTCGLPPCVPRGSVQSRPTTASSGSAS